MAGLIKRALRSVVVWLVACAPVLAQAVSTASIGGTVRDQSGGILPGVTITAAQTETGLRRTVVSDSTGSYTIASLPVGPYRLEFVLEGFGTYVQTGIVLQVNTNPAINAALAVGNLTDTITVSGSAPLIETRSSGIGQVVDQERIIELPLNGRRAAELIALTGIAIPDVPGTQGTLGSNRALPTQVISVAGGLATGTMYLMDGAIHNDAYNNQALPFAFPDALQEFKVETSALPAQYGLHSAAVVNAVTKSGTNRMSGSVFEFYRDDALNATNPFAAIGPDGKRRGDGLNRHQLGTAVGGPIVTDKLFYFGGYQGTRTRVTPTSSFQFVPTPAMLAGDLTAVTSPACAGQQVALRAPFIGNRIDPALLSPASLALASRLPASTDPCGRVFFDRRNDSDEHTFVGKIDYAMTNRHSMFGRLQVTKLDTPSDYDGSNPLTYSSTPVQHGVYSFVFGDQVLFGANAVNSIRVTVNRLKYAKPYERLLDYLDIGIRATPGVEDYLRMQVGGGFSLMGTSALPGDTSTWTYQVADDFTLTRGAHQIGFGGNYIHSRFGHETFAAASGNVVFTGQFTGLGLADFLAGRAASFSAGSVAGVTGRADYIGLYVQDTWRLSPNITVTGGLRWEPFLPMREAEGEITAFDRARFDNRTRSSVFVNAPPGLIFPGDEEFPGNKVARNDWQKVASRASVVWDPQGEGRMSVRAAYGRFHDALAHWHAFGGLAQVAPWGNTVVITNIPSGWDDPWAAVPGGDPVPFSRTGESQFPASASYTVWPFDLQPTTMDQWNVSVQQQLAADWMVSVNYLGSSTKHVWSEDQINPAVYIPGASTVGNTNQRRVLALQDPVNGAFYSSLTTVDDDGTASYRALLFSMQRRRANGLTLQTNYTLGRCITDPVNYTPGAIGPAPHLVPGDRGASRGRCAGDSTHTVTGSLVYQTPAVGTNAIARALTGGWQVSGIFTARAGSYFTVTTGQDSALSGQPGAVQRANQLPNVDPYLPNQTFGAAWLNRAAFQAPDPGTYGTMSIDALRGPGRWNVDMGLTRSFRFQTQRVQLRIEAFNVFNHVNPSNPVSALNSPNFGQIVSAAGDPRILQLAVKYLF